LIYWLESKILEILNLDIFSKERFEQITKDEGKEPSFVSVLKKQKKEASVFTEASQDKYPLKN